MYSMNNGMGVLVRTVVDIVSYTLPAILSYIEHVYGYLSQC